jgi:nuclear pore complex protein Nup54
LYLQAVGYNCLPSARNEEGLVALTFDRKMPEVSDNQQSIVDALQRLTVSALQRMGVSSQLQLSICVDGVRPLIDEK